MPKNGKAVVGYFGSQALQRDGNAPFINWARSVLNGENGPSTVERAVFRDSSTYWNDVFIGYWAQAEAYAQWCSRDDVADWWSNPSHLTGDAGIWREVFTVAEGRQETLFSSPNPTGLGAATGTLHGPVQEHNYWGASRDRMPDSDVDMFAPANPEGMPDPIIRETRGKRIRPSLPDNVCLIRSGQNWSDCSADELRSYLDRVKPVLVAGLAYLRDYPVEASCFSCRSMDELELDGTELDKGFAMALFKSLEHQESWTSSHPTHLSIYNAFIEMVQTRGGATDLKLWHEVMVLSGKGCDLEYVNCHPRTGVLPFFS
ncbi:MAG: phenylacetaldoxime dehydratase family protein [Sphingomonadaceae bacterium]|nr:phenylacetaldoxime dehydratase family protein [Sphingomonadaceae bacterium]